MKKQKHRELEQIPPRLSVRRQQSQGQTRAGRSWGWCSNHCATLPVCAPSGFPGAVFTGWFVRVGWTVPQQEPSNLSSLKQQKFISCLCYMITEGQLTCHSHLDRQADPSGTLPVAMAEGKEHRSCASAHKRPSLGSGLDHFCSHFIGQSKAISKGPGECNSHTEREGLVASSVCKGDTRELPQGPRGQSLAQS